MVTGHANSQNAAKLTRVQKEQLKETLSRPPSQSGVQADFWDVPTLRDVVEILFDVEYQSDSTYQLLLKFCGMSFKLPDPFDKRRDEAAITKRMTQIRQEVADLLTQGWEVYSVDEVRVEHESETRRAWLPKGERTKLYVDRRRAHQSFFGALSLTDKKMRVYPIEGEPAGALIEPLLVRVGADAGEKASAEAVELVPGAVPDPHEFPIRPRLCDERDIDLHFGAAHRARGD